jgi:YD repeat-containing protein
MAMRFGFVALLIGLIVAPASAQTSRTFQYDALGRLTKVTPSSGNVVTYSYDAADNRTSVVSQAPGGYPVTVNDTFFGYYGCPAFGGNETASGYPVANDYDTGGSPLTLTSITGSPYVTFSSSGLYFNYWGPIVPTLVLGYTVMNSSGASAAGTITITAVQFDVNDC